MAQLVDRLQRADWRLKAQSASGLHCRNRRNKALDAESRQLAPQLPSLREELGDVSEAALQRLIELVSARAWQHVRGILVELGMTDELVAAGRDELREGGRAPGFRLTLQHGAER
eukprot:831967-Prymnesium_polylepis.1